MRFTKRVGVALLASSVLATTACSPRLTTASVTASRVPVPAVGAARSPRVARIVEPRVAPGVFPRLVHDVNGDVTIPARPMHIHTLSVGFDEITFRLVDLSRIAAIGTVTANPDYSNVADLAALVPSRVGRDAEQILAVAPDLVVASPFASPDLIQQLRNAGVPLVVADLVSSVDAQAENIRFMAYLYGEEDRGEELVAEVDQRIARLHAVVDHHPRDQRPGVVVLSSSQTITAAGGGSTEDGVIQLAGARNLAAEAGIVGNQTISLEVLSQIAPLRGRERGQSRSASLLAASAR